MQHNNIFWRLSLIQKGPGETYQNLLTLVSVRVPVRSDGRKNSFSPDCKVQQQPPTSWLSSSRVAFLFFSDNEFSNYTDHWVKRRGSISSSRAERTNRGLGFLWTTWSSQNNSGAQQEGMGPKSRRSQGRESHWLIQENLSG